MATQILIKKRQDQTHRPLSSGGVAALLVQYAFSHTAQLQSFECTIESIAQASKDMQGYKSFRWLVIRCSSHTLSLITHSVEKTDNVVYLNDIFQRENSKYLLCLHVVLKYYAQQSRPCAASVYVCALRVHARKDAHENKHTQNWNDRHTRT